MVMIVAPISMHPKRIIVNADMYMGCERGTLGVTGGCSISRKISFNYCPMNFLLDQLLLPVI